VRPERFELPTYSSGGCRSIQTELRARSASVHRGRASAQRRVRAFDRPPFPSAAKARTGKSGVIAAVNRCATQRQEQDRVVRNFAIAAAYLNAQ
jgi:hypothetical protein